MAKNLDLLIRGTCVDKRVLRRKIRGVLPDWQDIDRFPGDMGASFYLGDIDGRDALGVAGPKTPWRGIAQQLAVPFATFLFFFLLVGRAALSARSSRAACLREAFWSDCEWVGKYVSFSNARYDDGIIGAPRRVDVNTRRRRTMRLARYIGAAPCWIYLATFSPSRISLLASKFVCGASILRGA